MPPPADSGLLVDPLGLLMTPVPEDASLKAAVSKATGYQAQQLLAMRHALLRVLQCTAAASGYPEDWWHLLCIPGVGGQPLKGLPVLRLHLHLG